MECLKLCESHRIHRKLKPDELRFPIRRPTGRHEILEVYAEISESGESEVKKQIHQVVDTIAPIPSCKVLVICVEVDLKAAQMRQAVIWRLRQSRRNATE